MTRRLAQFAFIAAFPGSLLYAAPPAVQYLPDTRVWALQGGDVSYVLGVNERGELQHIYWGKRIPSNEEWRPARSFPQWDGVDPSTTTTPEEYPGWGGLRYFEPCLKVAFAGEVRDLVLKYRSHDIRGAELVLHLADTGDRVVVDLAYRIYGDGILRKQVTVHNTGAAPVTLERFQSGVWQLPENDGYRLSYLSGRWAEETQLTQVPLARGSVVLESRRGNTSNQSNPWFAIDGPQLAGEDHGDVFFGALGWSGNWRITIEQTPQRALRITGGLNSFDFGYPLKPGEQLASPPFYAGFTHGGFGEASRILHRFEREEILPRASASRLRPILYNGWEATGFDFDEAKQRALAAKAARLGVERFVIDDGWFGARDSSRAGLGDWVPNHRKFPRGLQPLIAYVKSLGMDFGLWVEPEMVNRDSDLYRAHADWVLRFPDAPQSEARNQLVLNLSREDVREYVFQSLDRLVSENDIAFLKWDLNRGISEPGWPEAPAAEQRTIWVRQTEALYEIIDRLRARHPHLEIESCASGGGRVDLGILQRTEQVWPSDNTDPLDRLAIQNGFSYAYAPKIMMSWVTDANSLDRRSTPLEFRFLAAMTGSLGIGADLLKWNDAESEFAARMIAFYKTVRRTVQEGDLYRLAPPGSGPLTAVEYLSPDRRQAVLFGFRHTMMFGRGLPAIRFTALDPDARYRIRTAPSASFAGLPETASGAYLMNRGLTLDLAGEYSAAAIVLDRDDSQPNLHPVSTGALR